MMKIVIIGGMGPQASIELHRRIIEVAAKNGAVDGHEFPEIAHHSLPVFDFISDQSKQSVALEQIVGTLKRYYPWQRWQLHLGMQHGAPAAA